MYSIIVCESNCRPRNSSRVQSNGDLNQHVCEKKVSQVDVVKKQTVCLKEDTKTQIANQTTRRARAHLIGSKQIK